MKQSDLKVNLMVCAAAALLTAVIGCSVIEYWTLKQNENGFHDHDPNTVFDEELGWSPAVSRTRISKYGKISSNSLGFRSREVDPNKEQILLLGDSVAWGLSVSDEKTVSYFLDQKYLSAGARFQVQNLAVSGYGIDQEYLYFKRQLPKLKKVYAAVLVLYSGNDLRDLRKNFGPKRKPIYFLKNDALELSDSKIKKYCLRNLLYSGGFLQKLMRAHPWLETKLAPVLGDQFISGEEAKKVAVRLLELINQAAVERGSRFLIVLMPSKRDFMGKGKSEDLRWFKELLTQKSYRYIDFTDTLENAGPVEQYYVDLAHLSESGHRLLAQKIFEALAV